MWANPISLFSPVRNVFSELIAAFIAVAMLWSVYSSRKFFLRQDTYIWNRHSYVLGVFSFAAAFAMTGMLLTSFIPFIFGSDPYQITICISSGISVIAFLLIGACHFQGGWGGRSWIHLLASVGVVVFFLANVINIFMTLVAIAPTMQHILDQLKQTALVLFFLGYAKIIWFSQPSSGTKLAAYMSFIGPLFVGVAVIPEIIYKLIEGSYVFALTTMFENVFYIVVMLYMFLLGMEIIKKKKKS